MPFRLHALDPEPFVPLFALTGDALQQQGARRVIADESPGFPCRVSLTDAVVGESLLLVHFEHQPARTPYRASHAVYVRESVRRAMPDVDEVPAAIASRMLSLRAFDASHLMIDAVVVEGGSVAPALDAMLAEPRVSYVHLHHAKQGCYAALATRP